MGSRKIVWIWSEGKGRCWFAGILVWEKNWVLLGELGSVGVGGRFWGCSSAGEVGFCRGENVVWSGFMR